MCVVGGAPGVLEDELATEAQTTLPAHPCPDCARSLLADGALQRFHWCAEGAAGTETGGWLSDERPTWTARRHTPRGSD